MGSFRLRKYPGFALQAALSWFDTGHTANADAAIAWAETSGLWRATPDPVNHVKGGFVDWIEVTPAPGLTPDVWDRYIDTSFYAIASWSNGYDFGFSAQESVLAHGAGLEFGLTEGPELPTFPQSWQL